MQQVGLSYDLENSCNVAKLGSDCVMEERDFLTSHHFVYPSVCVNECRQRQWLIIDVWWCQEQGFPLQGRTQNPLR